MTFVRFACICAAFCFLIEVSAVTSALTRNARESETSRPQTENGQQSKVQDQLLVAFDSFKKSIEELTSKINAEEIIQGVQNLTSALENYAKKTADQLASTASAIGNAEDKKE